MTIGVKSVRGVFESDFDSFDSFDFWHCRGSYLLKEMDGQTDSHPVGLCFNIVSSCYFYKNGKLPFLASAQPGS